MRWFILALCTLATIETQARFGSPKPPPEPAYDSNLFKKDTQVFSLHGEFLFWRVEEGALDYAIKMRRPAWGPTASYAQGEFKRGTYSGEPGVRIKASYFRAPRFWEIWWQYTRLTASGHNSSSKPHPDQAFLNGTWPQELQFPLAEAKSWLHLNYNVADFLIDRYWVPNPHLRLRLIGGAFVAWMDQDWKVHYEDSFSGLTKVRSRWKYSGGGFRVGTMVDWYMGAWDLYLTALATTGATLGIYKNRTEQTTTFAPTVNDNTSIPIRDVTYRDVRPAFTAQLQFGPSWQKCFNCSRVEVFAGYELNLWFNLQEVYRSTAAGPSVAKETWLSTSALALQGLTTRVTVDF